ncbi:M20 metallopeptidase family protein [Brevibacillus sp. NRS-1366]|uniref:M20 metallopeptidase family protein n=1 Tax=Brevibacillus sp. NRS-1366 TaxID=3233899 RepID=UPI003D21F4DE
MSTAEMQSLLQDAKEKVRKWRRWLHQNPELSNQEVNTAQFVVENLESFEDLIVTRPTKTSVMARLVTGKPGKVLAIRADMDALPIEEKTDLPYRSSVPGVMHACGHDGHTSILLGTAWVLTQIREELTGEIRFLFQHAEERITGADEMIQAGVLEGVDLIVGAHLWPTMQAGKIGVVHGRMMAASDGFEIQVRGKGGHAALPHQTVDSILIGTQIVQSLQHIASRQIDPLESAVVSVTQFTAGSSFNVIPDEVLIRGCVRTFDENIRKRIQSQIENTVSHVTQLYGAGYELEYFKGGYPLINDERVSRLIAERASELFSTDNVLVEEPQMISEDFAAYLQKVPGAFLYLGTRNEELGAIYPLHHPQFTIDEESLGQGVELFVGIAQKITAEGTYENNT